MSWDARFKTIFGLLRNGRSAYDALRRSSFIRQDRPHRRIGGRLKPPAPADTRPFAIEYPRHPGGRNAQRWVIGSGGRPTLKGKHTARRATSFVGTLADITEARSAEADAARKRGTLPPDGRRHATDRLDRRARRPSSITTTVAGSNSSSLPDSRDWRLARWDRHVHPEDLPRRGRNRGPNRTPHR